MFVSLGKFGLIINGIRNCVGLVIFGLFVSQFDFQEHQKVVHLLVELGQIMHVEHVRVKVGVHVRNSLFCLFFLFIVVFCFFMSFMFWSLLTSLVRVCLLCF